MTPDRIRDILEQEANAIRNIPVDNPFSACIDTLHAAVVGQGGKVICSGMGKAGQIAHNLATTLSSTGIPAYFLHPSEAQHGDLGIIGRNDVLFMISNSGKTREILELCFLSERLVPGIPKICLTGHPDSELAGQCHLALFTGNPAEVCPLGLTPTTSTTVMTAMCDVLVVGLMEKNGFTAQQYALRHHSGYLGSKARNA
jgi:arabinose-5-phosphate isomerase